MEEGRRDEDVPSTFFCGSTLMDKYSYPLLLLSTRPKIQIFRPIRSPLWYFVRRPNSESSISTLPWMGFVANLSNVVFHKKVATETAPVYSRIDLLA